ncbi:hypothetical protein CPB85DRAFT_1439101 [Mucidula mucida]|nr:hypothetical protein CPB85DRAFT_1439101 [Mucidula mucida]
MVAYQAPSTASPAHKTFAQFVSAFNAFNIDGMLATFDDDSFEFIILPTAMKVPKMNKQQFGAYMKSTLGPSFDGMSITVHNVIEAENTIVAHAQSDSISKQGTEWHNEYIFIFKFTAGPSPKITSYTEYVNSAFVAGFTAQEAKKRKAKAKAVL